MSGEIKFIHIKTTMFDDEKILIIESMPDADTLLILWVKLICLAGKLNLGGYIYLNEDIPLNEEQLATILKRPVNTVRLALNTFAKLKMIEMNEDGHLYLINWSKNQNLEALEKIREDTRNRVARFRERQKALLQAGNTVVTLRNEQEKEKEKEKEEEEEEEERAQLKKMLEEKRYDEIIIGEYSLNSIISGYKGEMNWNKRALDLAVNNAEKIGIKIEELV